MDNELLHHIKPYFEIQTGHIDARRLMVNIIDEANIRNTPLQRENIRFILYHIAKHWTLHFGYYPFDEVMELWQNGPVLRQMYGLYERKAAGGYLDVKQFVQRAEPFMHVRQGERVESVPMAYDLPMQEYSIIRDVIRHYGHLQKEAHIDLFMRDIYQLFHIKAHELEQYGVHHFFEQNLQAFDEKGRYGLNDSFFIALGYGTIGHQKTLPKHLKHYGQIKAKLKNNEHVCYGFYYMDTLHSQYYVIDRERRFIEIDPFTICHATPFKPANEPSRFVYVQDVLQKEHEKGVVQIERGRYIVVTDKQKEPLESWLQRCYIIAEYPTN